MDEVINKHVSELFAMEYPNYVKWDITSIKKCPFDLVFRLSINNIPDHILLGGIMCDEISSNIIFLVAPNFKNLAHMVEQNMTLSDLSSFTNHREQVTISYLYHFLYHYLYP
jgi:hypothetical protein